eukprot:scaffold74700_cov60-Phaeocystis_antarctica.AAC.6
MRITGVQAAPHLRGGLAPTRRLAAAGAAAAPAARGVLAAPLPAHLPGARAGALPDGRGRLLVLLPQGAAVGVASRRRSTKSSSSSRSNRRSAGLRPRHRLACAEARRQPRQPRADLPARLAQHKQQKQQKRPLRVGCPPSCLRSVRL